MSKLAALLALTLHNGDAYEMPRAPVALNKSPGASYVDCVPRVPESVAFESHTWLISSRLAIAFDHNTVEAGVTALGVESSRVESRRDETRLFWVALDRIRLGCVDWTVSEESGNDCG